MHSFVYFYFFIFTVQGRRYYGDTKMCSTFLIHDKRSNFIVFTVFFKSRAKELPTIFLFFFWNYGAIEVNPLTIADNMSFHSFYINQSSYIIWRTTLKYPHKILLFESFRIWRWNSHLIRFISHICFNGLWFIWSGTRKKNKARQKRRWWLKKGEWSISIWEEKKKTLFSCVMWEYKITVCYFNIHHVTLDLFHCSFFWFVDHFEWHLMSAIKT